MSVGEPSAGGFSRPAHLSQLNNETLGKQNPHADFGGSDARATGGIGRMGIGGTVRCGRWVVERKAMNIDCQACNVLLVEIEREENLLPDQKMV